MAAMTAWRNGGSAAAEQGWADTGMKPAKKIEQPRTVPAGNKGEYREDMVVKHAKYGRGKIVEISGHGATRRLKVRFAKQGVVTFVANMAKLEIVGSA
jgi:hypothetical protein